MMMVEECERRIAEYSGSKFAVGVASGTDAYESYWIVQGFRDESAPFFDIKSIQDRLPPGATVVMRHGEPAIVVEGSLMYGSGSATITSNGKQILDRVAGILNRTFPGNMVRVEGHTDADPIKVQKKLYADNWDLASKRATEVVRYLVDKGVDPKRIYAGSFSMYQPVSSDKAKNRRVEIVVLPASGRDSGTVPTVKTSKLD
jgi:flagellar motor protein MotB